MWVVSKEAIIKEEGEAFYKKHLDWLKPCEKKEVYFKHDKAEWGICVKDFYYIRRTWCVKQTDTN